MLRFILILITLYPKGYEAQECIYQVDKFTEIVCDGLINVLKLKNSELQNLEISTFQFLFNLEKLEIIDSNIREVSPGQVNDLWTDIAEYDVTSLIHGRRYAFIGIKSHFNLDLSFNELANICNNTFSGPKIQQLDLSYNTIEIINL
ncbi:hypothetical protein ILUMI_25346 [Ignelater luminosus]|uniref:Uncharacterized protein n=1 Tax=Ignelater luminosus TaxID=2038154 RepID=A0A8K0C8Q5_IGNLU|nr:hypothetical protein ILUMI_25346 [Ignelater luminosus]